mgnify:CR=1 FL=1
MKKILTRAVLAALVTLSATGAQAASIEVTKESSSLIKIDNSVKYKASQATSNGKVTVSKEAGNDLSGTESVQPIFIRTLAGQTSDAGELAIVEDGHIFIPLSVYQTVNLNTISIKNTRPILRCRHPVVPVT